MMAKSVVWGGEMYFSEIFLASAFKRWMRALRAARRGLRAQAGTATAAMSRAMPAMMMLSRFIEEKMFL